MKVVMISGWAGSGKDASSEHLTSKLGFKRVAFADPLKDLASKEYGVPREFFDDRNLKDAPLLDFPVNPKDAFSRNVCEFMVKEFKSKNNEKPVTFKYLDNGNFVGVVNYVNVQLYHTPRSLAILKGSTNRVVDSSYWIKLACKKMVESGDGPYVITDLRYKSEVYQVAEIMGISNVTTLRLVRHETTTSTDPSERDLDDFPFDKFIQNRGSLEDLYASLEKSLGLSKPKSSENP